LCPWARRLRATAPPTLPVIPVIANIIDLLRNFVGLDSWPGYQMSYLIVAI
jgi:hypothetical protein